MPIDPAVLARLKELLEQRLVKAHNACKVMTEEYSEPYRHAVVSTFIDHEAILREAALEALPALLEAAEQLAALEPLAERGKRSLCAACGSVIAARAGKGEHAEE